MNNYDLGCGAGGGDSALQVFQAAGLAFSDGKLLTPIRESENGEQRGVGALEMEQEGAGGSKKDCRQPHTL